MTLPIPAAAKRFERDAFLDLPYFDHMHRYLPRADATRRLEDHQRAGHNHRHRDAGVSKYNNLNRALMGIRDLCGVAWLIEPSKRIAVQEVGDGRPIVQPPPLWTLGSSAGNMSTKLVCSNVSISHLMGGQHG
jgi:hypothetical protein